MTVPLSRVRVADLFPMGTVGLRTRRVRAVLSTLGVAIGIAALVAVLGITRSSQADLLGRIDRLGTNLLTVVNGRTFGGDEAQLPKTAAATIARTEAVLATAPTAELNGTQLYRSDRVPTYRGGGLNARACDPQLLSTLDGHLAHGAFLNEATARYPVTVLGYGAAQALGIANVIVIAVVEGRTEIGLRRALGAARRHVAAQFLIEALLLGASGGVAGVLAGTVVTYVMAYQRGWQPLIPATSAWAGLAAAMGIGAIAGLYPALRAARLSPTDALRTV